MFVLSISINTVLEENPKRGWHDDWSIADNAPSLKHLVFTIARSLLLFPNEGKVCTCFFPHPLRLLNLKKKSSWHNTTTTMIEYDAKVICLGCTGVVWTFWSLNNCWNWTGFTYKHFIHTTYKRKIHTRNNTTLPHALVTIYFRTSINVVGVSEHCDSFKKKNMPTLTRIYIYLVSSL